MSGEVSWAYTHMRVDVQSTVHCMDPKLRVTIGCGISLKNTKHTDMHNKTCEQIHNSK